MATLSKQLAFLSALVFLIHQAVAQNQCNQMPITTMVINSSTQASNSFQHMFCNSDFKTHEEARNAGIALGVLVYDVPLSLQGTFSDNQKSTWKHAHCESTATSANFAQSYQRLMKFVSTDAYKAWSDCQRINAYGVSCWIETTEQGDEQLVFRVRWNPIPGDMGTIPRIQDSSVVGAKKSGAVVLFPRGTDVSVNPSALLTRDGDSTVAAVINTNRGSCPAYAAKPAPVFETVYVPADPMTGQPYQQTISFDKNPNYTQPPKPRGEGHEITYSHTAPGPVTSVQCVVQPGGGGGWTHTEVCTYQGTAVRWEGWSNSGDHATIVLNIQYKMPTQQCKKHCG